MFRIALAVFACLSAAAWSVAGPVSAEEGQRQAQVMDQFRKALDREPKAEAKVAVAEKTLKEEPSVELRHRMLDAAAKIPGPEIEPFLTARLTDEGDAGLRSRVAKLLGERGSEKCLGALVECAVKDKTTDIEIGCIRGRSSARRAATFAVADLVARYPKLADAAAAKLSGPSVPVKEDPRDNEGLVDARMQALYRITRDEAHVQPFYDRLKSQDAKVREKGVVAFRFLKLKKAPPELVETLKDADPSVRQWAALVLGEIGDAKTADTLLALAADAKENLGVRCNAIDSVGRLRIAATAGRIEKLLLDDQPAVQTGAAIALYRITGKKVKQFPEGYNAD